MNDDDDEFYILDARSVVGNCASWWCPNGKGYTCELDKAGLYSREHAFSERKTDVPIPRALVQALAITHVRGDQLRRVVDVLGYAKRASSEREDWWAEQQAGIANALQARDGASAPWDASRIPPDMRSALTMVLDLPSDATDEQVLRAAARARSAEVGDRHCMDPAGPARGESRDESEGFSIPVRAMGICGAFKPGRVCCKLDHPHEGKHDFGPEHTAARPEPTGETERKIQALGRMDVALARARRERAERQHGCVKGRDAAEPAAERDTVTVVPTPKAEFVLRAAGMWPPAEPSEVERLRAALQRIVDGFDDGIMCTYWDAAECRKIATDALAAGPTDENGST